MFCFCNSLIWQVFLFILGYLIRECCLRKYPLFTGKQVWTFNHSEQFSLKCSIQTQEGITAIFPPFWRILGDNHHPWDITSICESCKLYRILTVNFWWCDIIQFGLHTIGTWKCHNSDISQFQKSQNLCSWDILGLQMGFWPKMYLKIKNTKYNGFPKIVWFYVWLCQ